MNESFEEKDDWNVDPDRSRLQLDAEGEKYLKKKKWPLIAVLGVITGILAVVVFLVLARSRTPDTGPTDAKVAATIFPVYDIARNVADGVTGVKLVLPPGASPHTFEPSPQLVASLQEVEVLFAVGHELDEWAFDLVPAEADRVIVDKGLAIIDIEDRHREGFDLGDADHHEEDEHHDDGEDEHHHGEEDEHHDDEDEHGHAHGDTDPHYWLSIPNGQMIARTMATDLRERFPEHKDRIDENLREYLRELDIAEANIKNDFIDIRNRKMITMHDAWYYFAVHYDFEIVGTFEPSPGREPTPRYLAELTDAVNSFGARVIYSEPQIATESIQAFARDRGLVIAELDPLGGTPGRDTFKKLIQFNAKVITQNQE